MALEHPDSSYCCASEHLSMVININTIKTESACEPAFYDSQKGVRCEDLLSSEASFPGERIVKNKGNYCI